MLRAVAEVRLLHGGSALEGVALRRPTAEHHRSELSLRSTACPESESRQLPDHVASAPPPILAIVGPTASGKTGLSIEVARRVGAEIISMDSRQLYRGMDIGTAKATAEEQAGIPHHGLDLVSPAERFSAGEFGRLARGWITGITARGRVPLLTGGTGFFLRSLTHPIFRQPEMDPAGRDRLRRMLERLTDGELHRWLAELDPTTAARLESWGGRQRLLRALEIPLLTGRTLSWLHQHAPPEAPPLDVLVFVLERHRVELDRVIDQRVDEMVRGGLLDEVRALLAAGFDEDAPGMRAHGYQEVIPFLRGEITLDQALEDVKKHTRAYARRQVTWFRHQLPEGAVWLDASRPRDELADQIEACVHSRSGR
jgi:tRNA dimethylallyltransferase